VDCSDCGAENRDGRRFCGDCGAHLIATCPACGALDEDGARFCGSCGVEIAPQIGQGTGAAPTPRRVAPDPLSYTPKHLADKILHSKSALEGERKQVTVLFADVTGSTELAETLDAEEWHGILDRFFQILAEGVHRFEGTVNQYTGDGIMALFGAPIAHEDHAQRACYAALQLQQEIKRYADELRVEQGLAFAVRMGLNSGEVVVGKIGDDLRMDYTAQGATVNLAARMQTLADPGKALIAEATGRLAKGYFELRDLGETAVRGVSVPVRVFELDGVGAYRTRLDRSRARGFTRFVGRERELALLDAALDRMLEGSGCVVGVVADAGTGKSRLCAEFVDRVRQRGVRLHEAHCPAHGRSIAFLPVLELLRSWFEITDRDSPRDARRKIAGDLTLLGGDFNQVLPLLFEFVGIADPDQAVVDLSPAARQRALFEFVRRLSRARSEREPAVLFIDDLHWIDSASDEFLAQLVEVARSTRTLVLVNFRPEYRAEWMQHTHYQQVPLLPLGKAEMSELLGQLLGADGSLEGLGDRIYERTGGNPFFAEEVVQGLIESGSLAGESGAYRLARRVERIEIPPTVQAVLAARIDRLNERDKLVLQAASVIGREVPEPLLREILEIGDEELATTLAGLQRLEFLFEQALYPEVVHCFKHALTRDVAYDSQLQTQRGGVHAQVARALEVREAERLDERSGLIAEHWEASSHPREAARWHMRAAEWAGYAHVGQSLRHLERVCELLDGVASDDLAPLALRAYSMRLNLGFRAASDQSELDRSYERGCELALQLGADDERVLLMERYAGGSIFKNHDPSLISLIDEAVELGRSCGNDDAWLVARYRQAWVYFFVDADFERAERLYASIASDLAQRTPPPTALTGFEYASRIDLYAFNTSIMRGCALPNDELTRTLDGFLERSRELRDFEGEVSVHLFRSWLLRVRGEFGLAHAAAAELVRLTQEASSTIYVAVGNLELGLGELEAGNWERASGCLQLADAIDLLRPVARSTHGLAEYRAGRHADGRMLSDQAMAMLETRSMRSYYEVHTYLARIRLLIADGARGHREEIEQRISQLSELLDASSNAAEAYVPDLARAELAAALGDTGQRERALESARDQLRKVGAVEYAQRLGT
jgi:class 3 adenylate cyclase/tetratricopeptide (TPR) repeat protein